MPNTPPIYQIPTAQKIGDSHPGCGSAELRGAGVTGFYRNFMLPGAPANTTRWPPRPLGRTLIAEFYHHQVTRLASPVTYPALDEPTDRFADLNIPVIDAAPSTDATLFYAALEHGVDGVVLQGVGAGNAPPAFTQAVKTAVDAGIPVVLSTRVPSGPVAPIYGNGGAVTLLGAGAMSAHQLNTYQARILLGVLVAQALPDEALRAQFANQTR